MCYVIFCVRLLSGKSWDEIIPEKERQKFDEEELHQQLVALNPPPRSRKTVNKSAVRAVLPLCRVYFLWCHVAEPQQRLRAVNGISSGTVFTGGLRKTLQLFDSL